MKRIVPVIVMLSSVLWAFAQSAENRYNSRMTRDGVLFFLMPEPLKDLSGIKKFEYDATLLSWTDSTTVNFTFESSSFQLPTDLRVRYGEDGVIECKSFSPLFIDIKKNHYEIRITSKFSNAEFESIIKSLTPPAFCFNQGEEPKSAAYKAKAWSKDRKKLNDIFQLYLYSK
ncbi:MAG: hypothetical protein K2K72_00805 [Duncaniella sp.]|nr:hypothetical protein [Duncaniella sp.]